MDEPVPFGKEWEEEVSGFPKAMLVGMLRKALIKNEELEKLLIYSRVIR